MGLFARYGLRGGDANLASSAVNAVCHTKSAVKYARYRRFPSASREPTRANGGPAIAGTSSSTSSSAAVSRDVHNGGLTPPSPGPTPDAPHAAAATTTQATANASAEGTRAAMPTQIPSDVRK